MVTTKTPPPAPPAKPTLSIGELSVACGLEPALLRAWEHRYGWPKPHRTASGYRVYEHALIEPLIRVRKLLAGGATPRQLLTPDGPDLPPLVEEPESIHLNLSKVPEPPSDEARRIRARLIAAIEARDAGTVRACCAELPRMHPRDRDLTIRRVLDVAETQLSEPDRAWLTRSTGLDAVRAG
jgi:hypothetical protein